jgi:TRAP-type C4-dicarboxylate transport system permease large subunit
MKEILPFYGALALTLMVTTFYPPLSLVLANWIPM